MESQSLSDCVLLPTPTNVSFSEILSPFWNSSLGYCSLKNRAQDVLLSFDIPEHPDLNLFGFQVDSRAISGTYNLVLPDSYAVLMVNVGVSISLLIGLVFATVIYNLLLDGKQELTFRKALIGLLLLVPNILIPYYLFDMLDAQNTAVRFTICIPFVLYLFKIIEATFGFVPNGATSSIAMYCKYFSLPVEFLFDEETSKPMIATKSDILASAKKSIVASSCIVALCWTLSPFDYMPFGKQNAGEFYEDINLVDYLDARHLGNCFAIAIFFQLGLSVADSILGFVVQIITGHRVLQFMKNPMLEATSPSDFWGRRWNILVHLVMKRGVYKPVRKYSSAIVASLAVFVASGLFHEWIVHAVFMYNRPSVAHILSSGDIVLGSNTAFFVWNFVVIMMERLLASSKMVKSFGMTMPRLLVTFTIIMTSLPFAHWFGNPYLKGQFMEDYEKCLPMIRKL